VMGTILREVSLLKHSIGTYLWGKKRRIGLKRKKGGVGGFGDKKKYVQRKETRDGSKRKNGGRSEERNCITLKKGGHH